MISGQILKSTIKNDAAVSRKVGKVSLHRSNRLDLYFFQLNLKTHNSPTIHEHSDVARAEMISCSDSYHLATGYRSHHPDQCSGAAETLCIVEAFILW